MNIEEIKKKLRDYNAEVVASRGCCDMEDFTLDVAFLIVENERLLSIIKQAEKDLQSIVGYPNTEMKSPEDLGYTYQTLAEEALQAIRK